MKQSINCTISVRYLRNLWCTCIATTKSEDPLYVVGLVRGSVINPLILTGKKSRVASRIKNVDRHSIPNNNSNTNG